MLRPNAQDLKVFLHRATVDMRKGRHGLAVLVREAMRLDVYSGAPFIFIGRRFDTLKLIYWEKNGFAVWHKVIESKERFHWPRLLEEEVITLSVEQLNWLLDGYDVWTQPHKMLRLSHVS
jgi:transposase